MKNNIVKCAFFVLLCGGSPAVFSQNIGINTSGTAPNASAQLDLNTGNSFTSPNGKGLLIPNVALSSSTDATTIASPATSLLVYVPSGSGLTPAGYYYNSGTPASPVWAQFLTPGSAGEILTVHCTNLTNNTATNFATISLPSGAFCGGMVNLCVYATNGTDYQSHTETFHFTAVNKGGTYTTQVSSEPDSRVDASSGAALGAPAYTILTGASLIDLQIKVNSSLTPLTTLEICYTIIEDSGKTITEL